MISPTKRLLSLLMVMGILLALLGRTVRASGRTGRWPQVDPWLQSHPHLNVLLVLREQADLSAAQRFSSRLEKTRFVVSQLQAVARRSQPPLLRLLEQHGVHYRSFWVVNAIWVEADSALLPLLLSQRTEVAALVADRPVRAVQQKVYSQDQPAAAGVEANLVHIGADQVWAEGITGQGVVIGGQDTGFAWDHPALQAAYRGWDGVTAVHDYNWHDAIHTSNGANPCGVDSPVPCDDHGHGTHTMGIMVGDEGGTNRVGVAPGARWIGCRNMDQGVGMPSTYIECFQWFLAPTDTANQNPRPDLAPAVINNSWTCPPAEGCDAAQTALLQQVVENVRAAGILVVAAAGNDGPACDTITSPPATFAAAFTVGAADLADKVAGFSSRGPAGGLLKPDLVAPGVAVRSSLPGGGYGSMSGTSMAAPHVAAVAALLLAANPALDGQVERLEAILRETAVPLPVPQDCGGIAGVQTPNPVAGYGRVDALAAVRMAAQSTFLPLVHYSVP